MKHLFRAILCEKRHVTLLAISVFTSVLFAFSGTLEMMSLGIMTKKGPDFFQLFGKEEDGKLKIQKQITKKNLEERWEQLDSQKKEYITSEDTEAFLDRYNNKGLINTFLKYAERLFPIEKDVRYLIYLLLAISFFKAITMFLYKYLSKLLSISVSCALRQRYFDHMQMLSMNFYQKHNIGSLSSRVVNDAIMIADAINSLIINYIQTPFVVTVVISFCIYSSWKLSMVVFLGLPLLLFPIIFLAGRVKRIAKQIQKKQEAFSSVLIEFLSGIQTVKIFAMEAFSLKKYREYNEAMAQLEARGARYDVSARPILHTIGGLCLVTAILFGLYSLYMPMYEVLAFCGVLSTAYEPIKKFAEEEGRVQRGVAAAERLFELLSIESDVIDKEGALEVKSCAHSIVFDKVSFRYDQELVLKEISFTIPQGQMVAIVGATGSGKSTIGSLLTRLYDPESGVIYLDQHPLDRYTQRSIRQAIGFVPQKPFLFFDTVRENIRVGGEYTDEEVQKAALQAHADGFIRNLPQGYDTVLAEAGKTLSGGQQQRLAIARALVKGASVLVFDEATAALDVLSESYIKETMEALRGTTTQIIIAHRLSTIEHADKIIFLDNGNKIAEGTRRELLETCPAFRTIWETLYKQEN